FTIDALSGRATRRYEGSAATISAFAARRDGGQVAFLEADASLGVWPQDSSLGDYAYLRLLDTRSGYSHRVPGPPIGVNSSLMWSSKDDQLWLHDGGSPEQPLYLLSLSSGARSRISPRGYSVTACAVSRDGRSIVAVLENADTPPAIYPWM